MKTVFSNDEIPHLWAHQTQAEGRNSGKTHYQIDEIDVEGNLRAGCHYIKYQEISEFTPVLMAAAGGAK